MVKYIPKGENIIVGGSIFDCNCIITRPYQAIVHQYMSAFVRIDTIGIDFDISIIPQVTHNLHVPDGHTVAIDLEPNTSLHGKLDEADIDNILYQDTPVA